MPSKKSPLNGKPTNHPKTLCRWSNESMVAAIKAVQEEGMGINRAALEHGVPRTTLKDRISGRVIHGTKLGPKPHLTQEEEKELVGFLVNCGYGKTRHQVLKIVEAAVRKKGLKVGSMHGWWVHFQQRWPQLSLRGDSFPVARDHMTTYAVFKSYFNLSEETLNKYGLKDKPAQIYNSDESGMPLEHKLPKTKGTKKVRQIMSANKTQITVLGCVSAAGQAMPREKV